MRKHSVVAGAGVVGATLVLILSGCSTVGTEPEHDHQTHEHEPTSQAADAAHNDADVAFASGMVPHHEQAVVMSDIILARQRIDPRVVELANQIKAAQGPEIETMNGWLTEWGTPQAPSGHEGHDMSGDMSSEMGMMSDQELEKLRQAQGADASQQFLTGMIAHHEGAVKMAQTEVDTGQFEAAVHMAHDVIQTQQREIDTMKQLLDSM